MARELSIHIIYDYNELKVTNVLKVGYCSVLNITFYPFLVWSDDL